MVLDDPRAVVLGSEPVRVDGAIVGRVTSGNYGFRVGASIAFGYVQTDASAIDRRVEIQIFGEWIGGTIVQTPIWDPSGARIRA